MNGVIAELKYRLYITDYLQPRSILHKLKIYIFIEKEIHSLGYLLFI